MRILVAIGMAIALAPIPAMAQKLSNTSGSVSATPYANSFPGTKDKRSDSADWRGTSRDLSAKATAVGKGVNGGTVTAAITSAATWTPSGLGGTVNLSSLVDFNAPNDRGLNSGSTFEIPEWRYDFTLDRAATLTFNYDIGSTGTRVGQIALGSYVFYLGGSGLRSVDLAANADPSNPKPDGSGKLVYELAANTAYSMGLYNGGNQWSGLPATDINGTKKGSFDFTIAAAAVPEPATWAMMIAGFGMTASALRTRRRLPAARLA